MAVAALLTLCVSESDEQWTQQQAGRTVVHHLPGEQEPMHMHEGGCLCGSVRYHVTTEPSDVINCSCRFCQRSTGAAYMVETLFAKENFAVVQGATKVYEHISEGSGKMVYVNFCADCGTKLFLEFDRFPTIVGVYSGTFDDPNWFPRTPENTQYFFLSKAQNGTVLPAGFEVFHEHYWQSEGVPSTPQVFEEHTVVSPGVKESGEKIANKQLTGNQDD